jgi:ribose-phosphate pyrophosphokinase
MEESVILATRSMRDYAERVCRALEVRGGCESPCRAALGAMRAVRFANGEMEIELRDSVRGKDVYLFANSTRNPLGISVDECKVELYHAVDALKRAKAGRLSVFEPFVSCSRSDRAATRGSVGLWLHFKILYSLGAEQIITFQLHSDKSKSMIDPALCRFDDIPASRLLKKELCDLYIRDLDDLRGRIRDEWAFCSVDSGGEKLAKRFASSFGTDLVIAHKQRSASEPNKVESVDILSSRDLKGKTAWIVDDMLDTAGSAETLVRELGKRGLKSINIAAVHPVFSEPAVSRLAALREAGLLDELLVMDTVPCMDSAKERLPFMRIVDSTALAAKVVSVLHGDLSMSDFFMPFDPEGYIAERSAEGRA